MESYRYRALGSHGYVHRRAFRGFAVGTPTTEMLGCAPT